MWDDNDDIFIPTSEEDVDYDSETALLDEI